MNKEDEFDRVIGCYTCKNQRKCDAVGYGIDCLYGTDLPLEIKQYHDWSYKVNGCFYRHWEPLHPESEPTRIELLTDGDFDI